MISKTVAVFPRFPSFQNFHHRYQLAHLKLSILVQLFSPDKRNMCSGKIIYSWQRILHLSCRVQSLPSFQAPRPCSVLKLLQTLRVAFSFVDCLQNV